MIDPATLTVAHAIIKKTGLDKWFTKLLSGTKAGQVAGQILEVAGAVTGATTPSGIVKTIETDPALVLQLQVRLHELAAAETDKVYNDIADARQMQEHALVHGDEFSRRFIYYLAGGLLGITILYMFLVSFIPVDHLGNQRTVDQILAFLMGTCTAPIMAFFFGYHRNTTSQVVSVKKE